MGRHYESHEWLNFLVEPEGEVTDEMRDGATVIRYCVTTLWWEIMGCAPQDEHRLAYLFHMTHTGAGTGFWDQDDKQLIDFGERLEKLAKSRTVSAMLEVAERASDELDICIFDATNPYNEE